MSDIEIEGAANNGLGAAEGLAGEVTDSPELKVRGAGKRIEGKIKSTAGQLEGLIGQSADAASAAVSKLSDRAARTASTLSDQARDVYDKASARARKTAETVEPFVHERPYAALGIAAVGGMVLGILLAGRGPKTIYIHPRV